MAVEQRSQSLVIPHIAAFGTHAEGAEERIELAVNSAFTN